MTERKPRRKIPTVHMSDIAGLVALADLLDESGIEGDVSHNLRDLAKRLAVALPPLPVDGRSNPA